MPNTLKALRVPAAMLALASVILIPAYFVSAEDHVRESQPCAPLDRPQHLPARFHLGEVVDVDTTNNWILVKSLRPNEEGENDYAYITYDDETSFNEDGEVVDESAITIGDKIHVEGDMNWDSEQYTVEIDADHVALFDETMPPRPGRGNQGTNPGANQGIRPQSNWSPVTE